MRSYPQERVDSGPFPIDPRQRGLKMRSRTTMAAALTAALATLTTGTAFGAGESSTMSVPRTALSPQQLAAEQYNKALKMRDKAHELEQKAAADPADAEKLLKKADKEYKSMIRALESAVEGEPRMYQAHNLLGYALRKTGDFEGALAAYDKALELNPRYPEAIEYRAEAHLKLNRLEDAKEAYLLLFRVAREHADTLMSAMETWVEERRANPAGVDPATVDDFARWLEERSGVAALIAPPFGTPARDW